MAELDAHGCTPQNFFCWKQDNFKTGLWLCKKAKHTLISRCCIYSIKSVVLGSSWHHRLVLQGKLAAIHLQGIDFPFSILTSSNIRGYYFQHETLWLVGHDCYTHHRVTAYYMSLSAVLQAITRLCVSVKVYFEEGTHTEPTHRLQLQIKFRRRVRHFLLTLPTEVISPRGNPNTAPVSPTRTREAPKLPKGPPAKVTLTRTSLVRPSGLEEVIHSSHCCYCPLSVFLA